MASIWMEERGKPAKKICGGLSPLAAAAAFSASIKEWPGPSLQDGCSCLLWRPGDTMDAPFGLLWLELMSPPTRPEPGQTHRAGAAGHGGNSD